MMMTDDDNQVCYLVLHFMTGPRHRCRRSLSMSSQSILSSYIGILISNIDKHCTVFCTAQTNNKQMQQQKENIFSYTRVSRYGVAISLGPVKNQYQL